MKKRPVYAFLTATLLVAALATPAAAAKNTCQADLLTEKSADAPSLAALDINQQLVTAKIYLAQPDCPNARYVLVILDNEGDTVPLAQATSKARPSEDFVTFEVSGINPDDFGVCVYAEAYLGRALVDRAKAEGCGELFDDGSSTAGGKVF